MRKAALRTAPLSAITRELGARLEAYRISRNIRQEDLAEMAGLSRMTISNLEAGNGGTIESLIRVLRALELEDRLFTLFPDAGISPLDPQSVTGKKRRRVRPPATEQAERGPWRWGDDRDPERRKP